MFQDNLSRTIRSDEATAGRRLLMGTRWLAGTITSLLCRWWGIFLIRSRIGLPWFWPANPAGQHAMVEARRMVRWNFGRDHHPVRRKLAQVLVTMTWPLAVLLNLWEVWLWLRPGEAMLATKRVPGALWAAIRHNILPGEYHGYELWRPDRRMKIDNYLYSNEAPRLFKLLNRPSQPDPIGDKLVFYEMCKAHVLPTPAVLAAFAPTGKLVDFESGRPPQHDLFVKACTGSGLAERFRWGGDFESNRGCRLKPEALAAYLTNRARNEDRTLIVQPVLSNHPDLRVDSNSALATVRLVTGRSIRGEVMPIFSFILFGSADRITAHSNCITLIDVANGRLMPAPVKDQDSLGMSSFQYRQFGSGDACKLPDWHAALHLVKVAHSACVNFVFVGWDVAFTPDGPMILEGNENWDAFAYQTLRGEPLGCTEFADILATQLCRNVS